MDSFIIRHPPLLSGHFSDMLRTFQLLVLLGLLSVCSSLFRSGVDDCDDALRLCHPFLFVFGAYWLVDEFGENFIVKLFNDVPNLNKGRICLSSGYYKKTLWSSSLSTLELCQENFTADLLCARYPVNPLLPNIGSRNETVLQHESMSVPYSMQEMLISRMWEGHSSLLRLLGKTSQEFKTQNWFSWINFKPCFIHFH